MQEPSTSEEPTHLDLRAYEDSLRKIRGLNIDTNEPDRAALNKQLRDLIKRKDLTPINSKNLKIKLEHQKEKRCISVEKPVRFNLLEAQIWKMYGKKMNFYYMQGREEVLISIRDQSALDQAVKMVERTNQSSLRLLLSQHEGGIAPPTWMSQPDASGVFSTFKEVPYTETCSSCGARGSMAPSWAGMSTVSSGIAEDDSAFSAPSPRAPSSYRKGKKIGSGSFGNVYVAHDVDTGRDLALKIIPLVPNNREAGQHARGLENDVETLAHLVHPRILQYLGVQNTPDSVLIFMEYMPGGSVKDLIKIEGRISPRLSKRYIGQVLEGLAFLHQKHIVHRDIKPANILRDLDGNVKIADFGSGKTLQKVASQNGEYLGTVHYTAPEVHHGKSQYGRKADVWSVGITLVEMLTGHVPWHELEPMAAIYAITFEEPRIDYPKDVDEPIKKLIAVLLNRNPEKRPFAAEILLNHMN